MTASGAEPNNRRNPIDGVASFLQTTASNLFTFPKPPSAPSSRIIRPIAPQQILSLSLPHSESTQSDSVPSPTLASSGGFPSTVRISRLNTGGPAFVGQVYSMCDLSGTGLMAVSTHFDIIPFLSKRTPEWIKKIFTTVGKRDSNGPVFRFFIDLGDAVSYVRRLNIPSGVVGACRLDLAYEHFKEKPYLFQFVPNEKQVKEANKLLKTMPQNGGKKKIDGVPVFSSQNLDIAIATTDGIKWYTPYFFDKKMLDNILEDSVDQHFNSIIQTRNSYRRKDVSDDSLSSEIPEEAAESMWEPQEVQELLDEVGHPEIPLNVVSKVAEHELLYAVDKVLLGTRWLRKAAGIQPKFPYMVESFERRSAASLHRVSESLSSPADAESDHHKNLHHNPIELAAEPSVPPQQVHKPSFQFPFGDWLQNPWSQQQQQSHYSQSDKRVDDTSTQELESSPFLPKITMVGISTGEAGQLSKAKLKKTMDDLTSELEQPDQETESKYVYRDPLFVSNVGDYGSGVGKGSSSRFVRGGIN